MLTFYSSNYSDKTGNLYFYSNDEVASYNSDTEIMIILNLSNIKLNVKGKDIQIEF